MTSDHGRGEQRSELPPGQEVSDFVEELPLPSQDDKNRGS
jgi:hypothetical protein